jgi:UDP-glucose 4-epimerase
MIRAIDRKTDGKPINLSNGEEIVTINELAETIIDISGKDLTIEHDLSMPTDTNKYAADTTKIDGELDWTLSVTHEEGLTEVYEYAERELKRNSEIVAANDKK